MVGRETHQGKGNVVRRMFADVDADVIVLVDGDATYDAPSAGAMIARLFAERLDMVVGARVDRPGNQRDHSCAAARVPPRTCPGRQRDAEGDQGSRRPRDRHRR